MTKGGTKIRPRVLRYVSRYVFAVVLALFLVGVGGGFGGIFQPEKAKAASYGTFQLLPQKTSVTGGFFTEFIKGNNEDWHGRATAKNAYQNFTHAFSSPISINSSSPIPGTKEYRFAKNGNILSNDKLKYELADVRPLGNLTNNGDVNSYVLYYTPQEELFIGSSSGAEGNPHFYLVVDKNGKILDVAKRVMSSASSSGEYSYASICRPSCPDDLKDANNPLKEYIDKLNQTSGVLLKMPAGVTSRNMADVTVNMVTPTGYTSPPSTDQCVWPSLGGIADIGKFLKEFISAIACEIALVLRDIGKWMLENGYNAMKDALGLSPDGKTISEELKILASGSAGVVGQVWKSILSIINFAALAGLLVVAFANVFRLQIDTYAVKKALPALVAAIILANFSFMICLAVLDFSTVLTNAFLLGELTAQPANSTQSPTQVSRLDVFKTGFQDQLTQVDSGRAGFTGWAMTIKSTSRSLAIFIAGAVVIALGFLLSIRRYIVFFLVALSPLAFFGLAFPLAKAAWDAWWKNFMQWAFMSVVVAFWLWLGSYFIKNTLIIPNTSGDVSPFAEFAGYFLGVLCLGLALYTPFKMSGAFSGVMSGWAGIGKKAYNNFATRFAGASAKRKAMGLGAGYINKAILNKPTGAVARTAGWIQSWGAKDTAAAEFFQSRGEQLRKKVKTEQAAMFATSRDPFQQRASRSAMLELAATRATGGEQPEDIFSRDLAGVTADEEGKLSRYGQELKGEDYVNAHTALLTLESIRRNSPVEAYREEADRLIQRAGAGGVQNIFTTQSKRALKTGREEETAKTRKNDAEKELKSLITSGGAFTDSQLAKAEPHSVEIGKIISEGDKEIENTLRQILDAIMKSKGMGDTQRQYFFSTNQDAIKMFKSPNHKFASDPESAMTTLLQGAGIKVNAVDIQAHSGELAGVKGQIKTVSDGRTVKGGLDFNSQGYIGITSGIHDQANGSAGAKNIITEITGATSSGKVGQMRGVLEKFISPDSLRGLKTPEQYKQRLQEVEKVVKNYQNAGIANNASLEDAVQLTRQAYATNSSPQPPPATAAAAAPTPASATPPPPAPTPPVTPPHV